MKEFKLKMRDMVLIKDLVQTKIENTRWVLKNKKPEEIKNKALLEENLEGWEELLKRIEDTLK